MRDINEEVFKNNKITSINIQGKPKKMLGDIFKNNGPGSNKNIDIEIDDCPGIWEIDVDGEFKKKD